MNMSWSIYTTCLIPLIKQFGPNRISKQDIQRGFQTWKNKSQFELIEAINESILSGIPLALYVPTPKAAPSYRAIYRHEEYYQTPDFLDKFLAMKGCNSLWEAVQKELQYARENSQRDTRQKIS